MTHKSHDTGNAISCSVERVAKTIVADLAHRPEVFPTDRLLSTGKARPELRAELRKIDDRRNAVSVVMLWFSLVALIGGSTWINQWWAYLVAFVLMGPIYSRFEVLVHEAAHKLLFTNKRIDEWVGTWVLAYPSWALIGVYRRTHFVHHKQEVGPDDADLAMYSSCPCTRRTMVGLLFRDVIGISGCKNFAAFLGRLKVPSSRRITLSIIGVQFALWAVMWALTGRWWIYPLLWWLPWMTQWRVLYRLISIAEHGGLEVNTDRRANTHYVRQKGWLAQFWIVPYNSGWHLAHHVDMGVPWRNLPRYSEELEQAGYLTDAITYPSYTALWRALTSA